jgi:hypothetical protein
MLIVIYPKPRLKTNPLSFGMGITKLTLEEACAGKAV